MKWLKGTIRIRGSRELFEEMEKSERLDLNYHVLLSFQPCSPIGLIKTTWRS
jgi:hypothetical protein